MATTGDYFAAARDLTADGDPRKVTMDALCKRVGSTSGSFYHHFGSLDGFVDALAADWADRAVASMEDTIAGIANLRGTRRVVNDKILTQHHQTEPAFRAWARTMRCAVGRVDAARLNASRTMVAALNPHVTAEEIEACAQLSVLILIGAQAHDPSTAAKVSATALASFAALIERR